MAATATTTTATTSLAAAAPEDQGSFHLSPSDSIRTRLFQLCSSDADWREVLAVCDAIAAKKKDIERCEGLLAYYSSPAAEGTKAAELDDLLADHEIPRQEIDDWTWPPRSWTTLSWRGTDCRNAMVRRSGCCKIRTTAARRRGSFCTAQRNIVEPKSSDISEAIPTVRCVGILPSFTRALTSPTTTRPSSSCSPHRWCQRRPFCKIEAS